MVHLKGNPTAIASEQKSTNNIIDFLYNCRSMGVLITDEDFNIFKINQKAMQMYSRHQLESLVAYTDYNAKQHCNFELKCEVEVIKETGYFIFLLQSKIDEYNLHKGLNKKYISLYEGNPILNASFDGIIVSEPDGTIVYQNPAIEQLTGLSPKDCIGVNVQKLIDHGIIDQSLTAKVVKENKPATIVQTYKSTGKKILLSGVPIRDENGEIKKVVSNLRDLTILNGLEKEIEELKAKNEKISEEIEKITLKQESQNSIIAHNTKMKMVIERAHRISQIESTVLILGESGVGKEGIVNFIYQMSSRRKNSFIQINCAAIPEQLLESELFGYEPGAFTGANNKGKRGLFEIATNGVIFLDEVGDMPLNLQGKLLRVLQENEITRVGGVKPIKIDVRVIAATNRNLEEMVEQGKFRQDLFYRLNIIPIYIPPLRERREDIIPLIYHFLAQIKRKYGVNRTFSQKALENFMNYDWPGNIRELQNMVERIALMISKSTIDLVDITNEIGISINNDHDKKGEISTTKDTTIQPLKQQIEEFEMSIINNALSQFRSIRSAAKALCIDQSTLVRKKQKYNL
ncbi:sigma-54-dependent Fis family transcriptional regulator [Bacillus sp. FJAT-29814]|uniref:sigma-54 interaction domain-containing protein n=1 Tax=Bacillus sp. FJAT-29814 TaxID=1729688 RepID=UPI000A90563D|nr:sigma 54-interacting transcriptional regulator [Bacillus sp. FJAT-29814]